MDAFSADLLVSPPMLFSIAFGLFLVLVRSPWPWTRLGGSVSVLLAVAGMALLMRDPRLRDLVLTSERLPILVLVLASCGAVWLAFRQALGGTPVEGAVAGELAWNGPGSAELLLCGCALVAMAAGALFLGAPLAPMADPSRPSGDLAAPWFLLGLQELSSYFDPWVPSLFLPALTILGLLALPYLDSPTGKPGEATNRPPNDFEERRDVVYFFLFVWFLLALFPMVTALFQVSHTSAGPALARPFSEVVWGGVLEAPPRQAWLRELPALLALGLYIFVLPRQLPRWKPTRALFGRYLKRLGPRRFHLAMAFMQLWMLLPLKMYGSWLLGIGYFLYLPEIAFNF